MTAFQRMVWDYYAKHGRDLPWRRPDSEGTFDPYKILVSEIMLQQTQVQRVIPKYHSFLERFPSVESLAEAPLATVLSEWSGLGYNRRGKYLREAARVLVAKDMPWQFEDLVACKGIGANTAAAVIVYAYNQSLAFVETNIRTIFIHHFFKDREGVTDKELLPIVESAIDRENPREWYWALMDYGVHLKTTIGNTARASKHYAKQSKFDGSKRQIRGQVLRLLADRDWSQREMVEHIRDSRLEAVLTDLLREGMISEQGSRLCLGVLE